TARRTRTDATAAARKRIGPTPQEADPHALLGTAMFLKARSKAPASGGPAISTAEADAIIKELETAISIAPQRKDVYLGLIDVETAAGHDDRTLDAVKRTAAQFPADPKAAASLIEYALDRHNPPPPP